VPVYARELKLVGVQDIGSLNGDLLAGSQEAKVEFLVGTE
jgi:hypothetical protein